MAFARCRAWQTGPTTLIAASVISSGFGYAKHRRTWLIRRSVQPGRAVDSGVHRLVRVQGTLHHSGDFARAGKGDGIAAWLCGASMIDADQGQACVLRCRRDLAAGPTRDRHDTGKAAASARRLG
jgi:hypothetical protein